ncbi:hypothetical protein FQN54_002717 [Arachnomyces sp. PD_36]|nr:hypothetical protein FQN54_002717 [Arachnomyces sp. PD_36]
MQPFGFLGAFAATAAATSSLLAEGGAVTGGTILRPHPPPGHDLTDVFHLIPKVTQELHFREEGSSENDGGAFGHMVSTFLHPTVILDHSSLVSSILCSDEGLDICFGSSGLLPLGDVSELWKLTDASPLIFSAFFPGCGQFDVGMRSFWKATGITLSPDGECVRIAAAEVEIEDAMSETELEWGSVPIDATSSNGRRDKTYYPDPDPHPAPAPGPGPYPAPGPNPAPAPGPNPGPYPAPGPNPAPAPGPNPDPNPDPNPGPVPVPAPDPIPDPLEDPKVDISNDPEALAEFFGVKIEGTAGDDGEDGFGEIDQDGSDTNIKRGMEKRFLDDMVDWARGAVETVSNAVTTGADWVADQVQVAVDFVVDVGKTTAKVFTDAARMEWSLSASDKWAWQVGQPDSVKPGVAKSKALFGVGEGVVISSTGGLGTVTCEKCGAKGTLTAGGSVAFSFKNGLTKGSISVGGSLDASLQLAVKVEGQYKLEAFKKQLLSVNPTPFQIPGIISLGPEIDLNAVVDLYYNGEAEFLVGADMHVKPGEASLDLVHKEGNKISGFDVSFEPVAKYRGGKLGITTDFGLPIGLKFGVNLFMGKFDKSIGLYDQPSIKVRAETGNDGCSGVDVNIGLVNYIYLSAAGIYDYAIRTDELAKFDIGCIPPASRNPNTLSHPTMRKFSSMSAEDDGPDAIGAVNATFGDDTLSENPPFHAPVDAGAVAVSPTTGASYRVIMDLDETVIMISGKDERVYLAPAGEGEADVGAPFACFPNITENVIISDVYGGFLNYIPDEIQENGVANLRSSPLTKVPVGSRGITLSQLYTDDGGDQVGMYVAMDVREKKVYILAVCRVERKGSRIYLVDQESEDPIGRLRRNELRDTVVDGDVVDCQPIFLTSNTHGLTIA